MGGVAVLLLAALPGDAAAECKKWVAQLTQSEALPSSCSWNGANYVCKPLDQLSHAQRLAYYRIMHSDTPRKACEQWRKYAYPSLSGELIVDYVTNTWYTCVVKTPNGNVTSYKSFTTFDSIQREDCCDAEIFEPPHGSVVPDVWYEKILGTFGQSVVARAPADGLEFTRNDLPLGSAVYLSQRSVVLSRNELTTFGGVGLSIWRSDLYRTGNEELRKFEPSECGGFLSGTGLCAPQVDHIIPRKDVKGCDCGPNSYKNALLISSKLNWDMSNDCTHPARVAILKKYKPPVVASESSSREVSSRFLAEVRAGLGASRARARLAQSEPR